MDTLWEHHLIQQIREGQESAWKHLIERYEGRLLAFARSRLKNEALAEDVVQETLIGFLTSLPNYDEQRTALEPFLFRIAAYKMTDQLRKQGRRPELSSMDNALSHPGKDRKASSMARSREQQNQEKEFLTGRLKELIAQWKAEKNFERLKCCELLFLRGWPNKKVAECLSLSEQQVANHKQAVLQKLKK